MFEKRLKQAFIVLFLAMILLPLCTTNLQNGKVSDAENRILAAFPSFFNEDGTPNSNFTIDFETWINDNIGFRSDLVKQNAIVQYYVFNQLANNSDMQLGPHGEFNYAPNSIIESYQHVDLRNEEELDLLAEGFQYAYKYLEEQGIQLYYFQCWDKQSIYPEHFPQTVIQHGDISRTDQIVDTLSSRTKVDVISPKEVLIEEKAKYDTYSQWGDSTHWTQRGSYIGYKYLMDTINSRNGNQYTALNENDYNITITDQGSTLFGGIHKECFLENFEIKQPNAILTNEKITFLAEDQRHRFFTNEAVDNKDRVLVLGDSYFNSFIIDDLAESFYETLIIWGDYTDELEQIIDEYRPDILIVENAERCDRADDFASAALQIRENQNQENAETPNP